MKFTYSDNTLTYTYGEEGGTQVDIQVTDDQRLMDAIEEIHNISKEYLPTQDKLLIEARQEIELSKERITDLENKSNELKEENERLTQIVFSLRDYFPRWEVGTQYEQGDTVVYKDTLYEIVTAHTSQSDWTPDTTPSIYSELTYVQVTDDEGNELENIGGWKQPLGAHDMYNKGDKVIYKGDTWELINKDTGHAPGLVSGQWANLTNNEPVEETPVEETPVEETPEEEPTEEPPVEETPEEEPIEENPVVEEDTITEEPTEEPIEETPVVEDTITEEPTEDTVEEIPEEDTITEEPTQEKPNEDSVVDVPTEEPTVEDIPEFQTPTATNYYNKGDKVLFEGEVYESTIDVNTYSPTTYPGGWSLVK